MTTSKTRYFKLQEIETGIFNLLSTPDGQHIQTTQVPGLETRCKVAKLGFHYWAFLPGTAQVLSCLACGEKVKLPKIGIHSSAFNPFRLEG